MNSKATKLTVFAVAAAVAAAALLLFCNHGTDGDPVTFPQDEEKPLSKVSETSGSWSERPDEAEAEDMAEEEATEEADEPAEPEAEEGVDEDEDEKKVEAFDGLVDAWMEKESGEVSMKDMDDFVASFRSVPAARKEECLHRALNLVSDDHVLLLAGILFDKTADKEHVELVFNDVLNRDESVKKLILPMIYKDKTHPCWADTAWILDATGETPANTTKEKTE